MISITPAAAHNLYSIPCRFGFNDYKIGGNKINSYYSCSVINLKNLNCESRLKDISDVPRGKSNNGVNGLVFTDTYLNEFPMMLTEKFNNLKYLEIYKTGFGKFQEDICSYSQNFEIIMIQSSIISNYIKLDSCYLLKDLKIENSEIIEISTKNSIDSLVNLVLKKNKIEKIGRDFFGKFKNVKNVQMAGNKINKLDSDTFIDNNALEIVNFSDNPILTIDGDLFRNNLKLTYVDFRNLKCINQLEVSFGKIKELRSAIKESC